MSEVGEEEIARLLCREEGYDPDVVASHTSPDKLWTEWLPVARAVLALLHPALERAKQERH